MNSIAEALGMSLPGCGMIPAPYRERAQMAFQTGRRAVELVREGLTPKKVLTRDAFENAITVASAIAGSTNAPVHLNAIARHAGVELTNSDWQRLGADVPILVNMQPAGEFLSEDFYRAGGVPAVMCELLQAGRLHGAALTVSGRTVAENVQHSPATDRAVIRPYAQPLAAHGGMQVLSGNLFESAVMKSSAISEEFASRYLSNPRDPMAFVCRAVVFDGPEDYHAHIDDPALGIDESSLLVIRYTGCIGYPGSAEVVNMQPPAALIKRGITSLPTLGDGRQSGTADAPSIVNASPEAAVGGNLAILRTGDRVRVDLGKGRVDVLISDEEIRDRRKRIVSDGELTAAVPRDATPWQEIYRSTVGQLDRGGCLELAVKYHELGRLEAIPRDSH
jgi:dihydroxy-acid dehydratase